MNVYGLLADPIRRLGSKVAISYGDRSLTFRGLDATTAALAHQFAEMGCKPGDRILIYLRNCFEYVPLMLAAMRGGFVVVPVNAKLHPVEVAWIAGDCQPKLIFTQGEYASALRDAIDASAPYIAAIEEFTLPQPIAGPPRCNETLPTDPAWIFYTSGTTGRPKGATLTHRNLVAASTNCLADIFDFRPIDKVLHVAPLSHGGGLYMLPSLSRGATNIISDRPGFQPDEIFDIIATEEITAIAFVAPTMIVRMLEAAKRYDLGSLRGVIYGGATIHLEHIKAAVARFGPIFHQLYGQGEAPMTISYLPGRDHYGASDEALLSAGYIRSGVEVRLLDENGNDVPDGEDGEICVRGDVVMAGYWQNEQATAAAIKDGWLHTGDIGQFDSRGRLRVLDRRHDTIISGGTNIYPKEIEDVIAAHPSVKEVIAFGLPDKEWGESVAVAIVKQGDLDADQVLAFTKERLASFKKPKRIIFLDELPKSAYGKVLRRTLRDEYGTK